MSAYKPIRFLVPNNKKIISKVFFSTSTISKNQERTSQLVKEAENIVGYPTSFLNLKWVINEEVANLTSHFIKLIKTNHPLLHAARNLLVGNQTPTWCLIVMLLSKAGGLKSSFPEVDCDKTAGILHSQRVVSEVTELVRISHIIHKTVVNKGPIDNPDDNFGNKLALLSGDYILSIIFNELAILRNQEINELVSTSIRDLAEAHFIQPRDDQNRPLPAKPLKPPMDINNIPIPNAFDSAPFKMENILGNAKAEWTLRHILGGASVLAKSCQATLKLAGHSEEVQREGYIFGRNTALAWQAKLDQDSVNSPESTSPFSMVSAPVLFHLQKDPRFYQVIMDNCNDIDFHKVRQVVLNGTGLKKTEELKKELVENAIKALQKFPENDSRVVLINIINAM